MPIDPSIISNAFANVSMPDVNALMNQRVRGAENIYQIETARQAQAAEAEQEAAKAQEDATFKALLPAYTYGIQTGDIAGAGNLVPPEMRPQLQQYIDALAGRSPQEVQAALIGSLSSSPMGQEALSAIQRGQTFGVQARQQDLAEKRYDAELAAAGQPKPMSAYEAATIRLREQEAAAVGPDGVKLKPGERKTAEGTVEAIPGSDLYNKQKASFAKDYKGATTVVDKIAEAQAKIARVTSEANADGFAGNFGGYNAAYVTQYFPGQTQDVASDLESLKADLKNAGLELIRNGGSIGQITEREWPIIEQQLASLTPMIGEAKARDVLANVAARLKNIADRATETYDMQWGDTQFYAPVTAKPVTTGVTGNPPPAGGGGISEGTTATNPQTGERIIYRDGQWQPL
jgi:hypothetical protein